MDENDHVVGHDTKYNCKLSCLFRNVPICICISSSVFALLAIVHFDVSVVLILTKWIESKVLGSTHIFLFETGNVWKRTNN